MTASILSIGDELVTGQTVDTNSAFLSRELSLRGIRVVEHHTVGDDVAEVSSAIRRLASRSQCVLVTGGLGPTEDDLTRQGLAEAMGCELVLNEESLRQIEEYFARRGWAMAQANRVQAMLPTGAKGMKNELGTAPGIRATVGEAEVFVLPGVPYEMQQMFREQVASALGDGRRVILHRTVHTFGLGESTLSERIADLMARGANPTVGTTVSAGMVSIRITSRATSREAAEQSADRVVKELRDRLGDLIVAEDDETLAQVVGRLLQERSATLSVAESCTGGLLGEMITAVAGSSGYFLGGVIAYANEVKQSALAVDAKLLTDHGAVSEPVAAAMADGGRERLGSDFCLAITGVAGPGGGSEHKPVGLIYIALADAKGSEVHKHIFGGTREVIRLRSALAAMNYLRLRLLEAQPPAFDR